MRFTVTVENAGGTRTPGDAATASRTFAVGDTFDDLEEVLIAVGDFLQACESDPQAALDDEEV